MLKCDHKSYLNLSFYDSFIPARPDYDRFTPARPERNSVKSRDAAGMGFSLAATSLDFALKGSTRDERQVAHCLDRHTLRIASPSQQIKCDYVVTFLPYQPGFTLLELVVSLLISALLATALLFSINQLRRSAAVTEQLVALDLRATLLQDQLGRDLAGAVTLAHGNIERQFFGESTGDGELQQLTFITVNPLPVFTTSAQRLVRVQYRLAAAAPEASPNALPSYQLYRRETDQLALTALDSAPEYLMIDEIKALKIKYLIAKAPTKKSKAAAPAHADQAAQPSSTPGATNADTASKKPGDAANPASQEPITASPTAANESATELASASDQPQSGFDTKQSGEFDHLPAYVEIELELWQDAAQQRSQSFQYRLPIYSYQYQGPKAGSASQQPASEKADDTEKPEQSNPSAKQALEKESHAPKEPKA